MRMVFGVGSGAYEQWSIDLLFANEAEAQGFIDRDRALHEARVRRRELVGGYDGYTGPHEFELYEAGEVPPGRATDEQYAAALAQEVVDR